MHSALGRLGHIHLNVTVNMDAAMCARVYVCVYMQVQDAQPGAARQAGGGSPGCVGAPPLHCPSICSPALSSCLSSASTPHHINIAVVTCAIPTSSPACCGPVLPQAALRAKQLAEELASAGSGGGELATEVVEEFISIADGQVVLDRRSTAAGGTAGGSGGGAGGAGGQQAAGVGARGALDFCTWCRGALPVFPHLTAASRPPSMSALCAASPSSSYAVNPKLSITRIGTRAYYKALELLAPQVGGSSGVGAVVVVVAAMELLGGRVPALTSGGRLPLLRVPPARGRPSQVRLDLAQADDARRFGATASAASGSSIASADLSAAPAAGGAAGMAAAALRADAIAQRLSAALLQTPGEPVALAEQVCLRMRMWLPFRFDPTTAGFPYAPAHAHTHTHTHTHAHTRHSPHPCRW